jgi:glycosyltransferase involved in cell wall biosynthesis
VGYADHHAEFARIITSGFASSFHVKAYGNFFARTGLLTQLSARPVFFESVHPPLRGVIFEKVYGGIFERVYDAMTRSLVQGLQQIDEEDLDTGTIAVMHTATLFQLGGLAQWISTLAPSKRPRLLLIFHVPLEWGIVESGKLFQALTIARKAVDVLTAAGTVRFASLSQPVAERVSEQFNRPCPVIPLPVRWPNLSRIRMEPFRPTFGFFGGFRVDKGAALLAEVIPRFTNHYDDVKFIIHAPRDAPGSNQEALKHLEGKPRVEVISTDFRDKDSYFDQFLRASCILLPYDPDLYAVRLSAVFFEALGLGRMIITTKGTSLEAGLNKCVAPAFLMPGFTSDDLFKCLEQARVMLLQTPLSSTVNWNIVERHSPAGFCKALLEIMS